MNNDSPYTLAMSNSIFLPNRYLVAEKDVARCKESHGETEILLNAFSALQDKTNHLENSLSAETRIKLDLFSALGEVNRKLEIKESECRRV